MAETICHSTGAVLSLRMKISVILEVPLTPGARFAKAVKRVQPAGQNRLLGQLLGVEGAMLRSGF